MRSKPENLMGMWSGEKQAFIFLRTGEHIVMKVKDLWWYEDSTPVIVLVLYTFPRSNVYYVFL